MLLSDQDMRLRKQLVLSQVASQDAQFSRLVAAFHTAYVPQSCEAKIVLEHLWELQEV